MKIAYNNTPVQNIFKDLSFTAQKASGQSILTTSIDFKIPTDKQPNKLTPLPPLVQASATDPVFCPSGKILCSLNMYIIAFIDTEENSISLNVDMNSVRYLRENQLEFYVSYTKTPTPSSTFKPFLISFTLTNLPTNITPTTVKLFLCNDDPETSRGTETTVMLPA
ncbi:hypothetical protein C7447_10134 [Tenacibaculum adriaticum]|uniref:Uncharacterized protein n=1 Tax=Tenacibaculum adriaticum TaxID=413713 RepID=A0A5S5DVY9_9FLAO|nr:hypothetical protein [Tenacibaculum adriaticum]TYP99438.1 hypothetical protein C7447_10134 [Tenacibaculum adriaticum]